MLLYDNASCHMPLEGGDVLVLSDRVIAVGCSQRTSAAAVDYLAQRFLADDEQGQRRLLVVGIPEQRACMHLDTVFTRFSFSMAAPPLKIDLFETPARGPVCRERDQTVRRNEPCEDNPQTRRWLYLQSR